MHADFPLKDIRVRAPCPNKRPQRLCVSSGVKYRGHGSTHNLKRLASARHDREKTVLLQNARFKQNSPVKTKKRMMYSPGVPYIAVAPVVTSYGCRRPTSGVFIYVYFKHGSR